MREIHNTIKHKQKLTNMKSKTLNLDGIGRRLLTMLSLFIFCFGAFAQSENMKITGKVVDEFSDPMMGVTILLPGTTTGTITDLDGNFSLEVPKGSKDLTISFIGYQTKTVGISDNAILRVKLEPFTQQLNDVVVVGYGTQRKSDLTGSVSNISSDDFNVGLINSPEQLINGKVSGVQIMTGSGSPTAGSTIRIRGGASLNASNDPLIVLDGVPLETGGISGSNNFLSLINPNDIENMTILKDASSTAIYGSRASNGVILITTKKGTTDKPKISFSTTNSIQTVDRTAKMLSRNEFVDVVNANGSDAQKALLGDSNTDWNDEVFGAAFGTDNNISISGRLNRNLPYRVSFGYFNQDGILMTDNAERYTGSINVTPSFFKDHLKLGFNVKGSLSNNNFANTGAIWNAATYNPTLPVYSGNNNFGGYTEGLDNTGNPVTGGIANPVGLLNQYTSKSTVKRVIGNFDLDYKFHFLPELRFHTTLGGDYAEGYGTVYVPVEAYLNYSPDLADSGRDYKYGPQENSNKLFTAYLNYNKYFDVINSNIDVTAGYDFQDWKSVTSFYRESTAGGKEIKDVAASDQRHTLLSYYARLNYSYDSRYMLTATVRRDGTSRFAKDVRWGTFPSLALGWRVTEEEFLKDNDILSNLKIRASYGVTGQQDGIGNYNYLPVYTPGQTGAQYQFGNIPVFTYRPEAYVANLKWETTTSYNYGFDFGFFDNKITGSFDYYTRKTKDLLATVPTPAGVNFDKNITTNVGNVNSEGFEFTISATPIDTKNFSWDLSFNATTQKMKVKNLSLVQGTAAVNTLVGPYIDGNQFQVLSEGYEPYMFFVYKQLYDVDGKPIEGAYADLNGDGEINSEDRYRYKSPAPDYILGLSTSFRYKKWNLGMSFRSNIGNYVYNGMAMNTGALNTMSYNSAQLNNLSASYLETGFASRQPLSDYYVENASFLKMDNISLGYNFGQISKYFSLNVSAMCQNVFTITKYSGVDPEVPNGMDNTFYPRPRTFSLSVGLEF